MLVLMIALPTMAADQVRNLKFVSTAWSPFTNVPGQPRFALDLVEAALERIGVTAETVIVDEARLTPSLLGGEFDGSAAVWKDAERERVLICSEPNLENRLILVGRQGSDVSATSLASLAGKRIALVAGYAYGKAAKAKDGPIIVGSTMTWTLPKPNRADSRSISSRSSFSGKWIRARIARTGEQGMFGKPA